MKNKFAEIIDRNYMVTPEMIRNLKSASKTVSLEHFKTTKFDKDTGKYECIATFNWADGEGIKKEYEVIYKTELVDGGERFIVSISAENSIWGVIALGYTDRERKFY
jgi:hypothetical protein